MWINFLVILMWITVKMTTLTVFLIGFVSSPEPENTTMVNLEGVVICFFFVGVAIFSQRRTSGGRYQ